VPASKNASLTRHTRQDKILARRDSKKRQDKGVNGTSKTSRDSKTKQQDESSQDPTDQDETARQVQIRPEYTPQKDPTHLGPDLRGLTIDPCQSNRRVKDAVLVGHKPRLLGFVRKRYRHLLADLLGPPGPQDCPRDVEALHTGNLSARV
jgi:protein required for attachment to host cells